MTGRVDSFCQCRPRTTRGVDGRTSLLMIPGPVEISPGGATRLLGSAPGHLAAHVVEAFGASIERMRRVWKADGQAQPFIVAGSGTLAMDMAGATCSTRAMRQSWSTRATSRTGCTRSFVAAAWPCASSRALQAARLRSKRWKRRSRASRAKVLFVTHVDTSTAVRVDPAPLAALARSRGVLSVFDGVCADSGRAVRNGRVGCGRLSDRVAEGHRSTSSGSP